MAAQDNGTDLSDEDLWAQALLELESGTPRPGTWAEALASSEGDPNRSKALYLKLRVAQQKALAAQLAESLTAQSALAAKRKAVTVASVADQLRYMGYRVERHASAWKIREPLGGKVSLASDDALFEYATGRVPISVESQAQYRKDSEAAIRTSPKGTAIQRTPPPPPHAPPFSAPEPRGIWAQSPPSPKAPGVETPTRLDLPADITWGRATRVWWSLAWRSILFGLLAGGAVGFLIGFVLAAARGTRHLSVSDELTLYLAGSLVSVPVGIWVVRNVLRLSWTDFRITLVPTGRR